MDKIDYVLSVTNKNDRVYDGDAQFNIFRKDLDFFWFSICNRNWRTLHLKEGEKPQNLGLGTFQTIEDHPYNIYELINSKTPLVISNYCIDNMEDERIREDYRQSEIFKDIYLRVRS